MKKRLLAALCAATMLTLTACGGGASTDTNPDSSNSSEDSALTIGMVVNSAGADTYQTTYYSTARAYAKELGINLQLLDPAGDATKQQNQVQDLIGMKCDAIVVWPVNSEQAVASVKAINEAGIPVMTTNTNVVKQGEQYLKCYVGPYNVQEGKLSAQQMVKDIGNDAKIVVIDYMSGYSSSDERHEGMMQGIEGTNIEVLDSQPGEANREKSQQVMENYLVKYPKGSINAVFCFDDNSAVGAINAIEAAGRDDVKVYAAAAGDYGTVEVVKSGKLAGVAMQSPITDARTALDYAVKIAKGEEIAEFYNYIDTPVATPENIDSLGIEKW